MQNKSYEISGRGKYLFIIFDSKKLSGKRRITCVVAWNVILFRSEVQRATFSANGD